MPKRQRNVDTPYAFTHAKVEYSQSTPLVRLDDWAKQSPKKCLRAKTTKNARRKMKRYSDVSQLDKQRKSHALDVRNDCDASEYNARESHAIRCMGYKHLASERKVTFTY